MRMGLDIILRRNLYTEHINMEIKEDFILELINFDNFKQNQRMYGGTAGRKMVMKQMVLE